jgi:transcriptional regulator of met regulon
MTHQITNGFKQMPDNDLISFGYDVKTGMTGNPVFTAPPAALGTLEKVLPEYQSAISGARGGDEEMRFVRNAKRAEVIALLTELAAYVTTICNGDPARLVSSGFKLRKARGTTVLLPIKELKVTIDRAGEAVTQVKRVTGAKAYIHQYTTDPLTGDNVWINQVTTELSHNFTGLKSKEKYWFQVIAIGLNGQQSASPLVARIIQG